MPIRIFTKVSGKMAKLMASVFFVIRKEACIRVNGEMTCSMERELNCGITKQSIIKAIL